jgi:hypothetical protein
MFHRRPGRSVLLPKPSGSQIKSSAPLFGHAKLGVAIDVDDLVERVHLLMLRDPRLERGRKA